MPIVTPPFGDLNRVAPADLPHPDVGLAAAIGTVGNEAAVGRPGDAGLQAILESEPRKRPLHNNPGSVPPLVKEEDGAR